MHPLRRLLALSLVLALLGGCASVSAHHRPDPSLGALGGVSFVLFADDDARAARLPGPAGIVAVLERSEGSAWTPVFRGLRPSWAVTGLEPGRYRVRVPSRLDQTGAEVALEQVAAKTFRVRPGQVVETEATLEHVSKGLVAAGIVAGVVAAIALHEWLGDHDLPDLPLPPPPPLWLADLALTLVVDLSPPPAAVYGLDDTKAPPFVVSGVVPSAGSIVPAGPVRVVVAFAADPGSVILAPEAIHASSDLEGAIDGYASWDPERWWLEWEPARELEPGEVVTVEIDTNALRGRGGRTLPGPVVTTFTVE